MIAKEGISVSTFSTEGVEEHLSKLYLQIISPVEQLLSEIFDVSNSIIVTGKLLEKSSSRFRTYD